MCRIMHRGGTKLSILIILISLGIGLLCFLFFFVRHSLDYVEKSYLVINKSMTRSDVNKALPAFRERKVDWNEVPQGYRETIPKSGDLVTYRYDYMLSLFSFHIVYDKNGRIFMKIPTYE